MQNTEDSTVINVVKSFKKRLKRAKAPFETATEAPL